MLSSCSGAPIFLPLVGEVPGSIVGWWVNPRKSVGIVCVLAGRLGGCGFVPRMVGVLDEDGRQAGAVEEVDEWIKLRGLRKPRRENTCYAVLSMGL